MNVGRFSLNSEGQRLMDVQNLHIQVQPLYQQYGKAWKKLSSRLVHNCGILSDFPSLIPREMRCRAGESAYCQFDKQRTAINAFVDLNSYNTSQHTRLPRGISLAFDAA